MPLLRDLLRLSKNNWCRSGNLASSLTFRSRYTGELGTGWQRSEGFGVYQGPEAASETATEDLRIYERVA